MRRFLALCVTLGVTVLTGVSCSDAERGGTIVDYSGVTVSCSYTNRVARLSSAPSGLSRVNFNYASSKLGGAQTEYHTVYGSTDSSVPTWARFVSVFAYESGGLGSSWLNVPCT
jgi:hypothetical protein